MFDLFISAGTDAGGGIWTLPPGFHMVGGGVNGGNKGNFVEKDFFVLCWNTLKGDKFQ